MNDLGSADPALQQGADDKANHKWHPHTVRVMQVLRENLNLQPAGVATTNPAVSKEVEATGIPDDGTKNSAPSTTYRRLTGQTNSRRTAAALFFELLQLKTLNYVQLDQQNPYGDITIQKGARFDEPIAALPSTST